MASNMKAVKLRIKSVQSTMQITKAMELVASSKLRKAKERAEVCRPYFTELHETLKEIARENTDFSSVYAKESSNNKTCYVVIAGDRGLAGGYNTNLFKCLEASAEGKDYMVLPVGKKAVEYFRQRGIEALTEQFAEAGSISVADCFEMANMLCTEFRKGTFGHIELCYTVFNSMLSQQPEVFSMLPMTDIREESGGKIETKNLILYEPDGETAEGDRGRIGEAEAGGSSDDQPSSGDGAATGCNQHRRRRLSGTGKERRKLPYCKNRRLSDRIQGGHAWKAGKLSDSQHAGIQCDGAS